MADRSELHKFYVQIIDHRRRIADALDGPERKLQLRVLMTAPWSRNLRLRHQEAITEAVLIGMDAVLVPRLDAMKQAHFDYADAAVRESEGNGYRSDTDEAGERHAAALSALWDLLKAVDAKRKHLAEANAKIDRTKKSPRRRRKSNRKTRPLTAKESEALQIIGDYKGNVSAAALQLRITRQALKKRYDKAHKKLGTMPMLKAKTKSLPTDKRGQANISESDDRRE